MKRRFQDCIVRYLIIPVALLITSAASAVGSSAPEADAPLRIYLDSDRTIARSSTEAIEAGMRTAVSLHGDVVGSRPIEFVLLDHRGNPKRSRRSLDQFVADPDAVAMFCGMHSPPVLQHRDRINADGILLLDPWAAAGPITRPPAGQDNWIFRLSVDDSNAGEFLIREAAARGVRRPALLLERTGWGESNHRTMTSVSGASLDRDPGVFWFDWGTSRQAMNILLHEIRASGADAVMFVGNAPEGAVLFECMAALPLEEQLPIYSHWGITGGTLGDLVSPEVIASVDLFFIQTKSDIRSASDSSQTMHVFRAAQQLGYFEGLDHPRAIPAPTGFTHGYDLMLILLAAMEQARGDDPSNPLTSASVRTALENLRAPVDGLVRRYEVPFAAYEVEGSAAHEALGLEDYTLARYDTLMQVEPVAVMHHRSTASAGAGGAE